MSAKTGNLIRSWAHHDRDTNAGKNALIAGIGLIHEMPARAA